MLQAPQVSPTKRDCGNEVQRDEKTQLSPWSCRLLGRATISGSPCEVDQLDR